MDELWWHAYLGDWDDDEERGVTVSLLLGASTKHPEELMRHKGPVIEIDLLGKLTTLTYVRSWDHEPSRGERESVGLDGGDELIMEKDWDA